MPAPLRIVLGEESDRTLEELRVAAKVAQHIKDRAHMVRLNAQGWNVPAIAQIFECQEQTVRETLRRWETGGLGGLWDAPGRVGLIYCQEMKKLVEVMAEETLGFGQRSITPVTDEVKNNGANNRPVRSGGSMGKGSRIFFQDDIFDPM